MTSPFIFEGGPANPFRQIISGTGITTITLGGTTRNYIVPLFRVSEYAGGVANLTVELYDGTNRIYLGSGGFTWNAKALTAYQSLLFDDGYAVSSTWSLRITASIANNVLVEGLVVGGQRTAPWAPPGDSA